MTPNAKRFVTLGNQVESNRNKAAKFESGHNYDSNRRDLWSEKADAAQAKQNELSKILTPEDKSDIEDFYGCGQMFDY